jgi:hypothetical protein
VILIILGGALILALFVALSAVLARDGGWKEVATAWAFTIGFTAVATVAAFLISAGMERL